MVNQIVDWQADELCGESGRRNGYHERRLVAVRGEITMRIPKLREGVYFPDELIRPCSRVDRAMVAIVKEAYVRGSRLQGREGRGCAGARVAEPSRISRMTADLEEEVAAFVADKQDFVFHGQIGGEIHLAVAMGLACVQAGTTVLFFATAELALALSRAARMRLF